MKNIQVGKKYRYVYKEHVVVMATSSDVDFDVPSGAFQGVVLESGSRDTYVGEFRHDWIIKAFKAYDD